MYHTELGKLADPNYYHEPLTLSGVSKGDCLSYLEKMMVIRQTEEQIADLVRDKKIHTPCHLAVGQEAIAVGVAKHLNSDDRIFGTHRSHAHFLALGGSINALLSEILGKATGCSKGLGGSMHLIDEQNGFKGSVPIVAGTVPLAVGAALAAKLDGNKAVAAAFFGDGAVEEGVVHEALNLASVQALPVLFVCENNLYASHLDINQRQPSDRVSRLADAHHITSQVIDGNDVMAVEQAAKALITEMRQNRKPAFLEVVTYRWLGHVGPNADFDVGVRRREEDVKAWKQRDPIKRLVDAMIAANLLTQQEYEGLQLRISELISEALEKAYRAPYPDINQLMDHIYG